jgi:hypothetical protein
MVSIHSLEKIGWTALGWIVSLCFAGFFLAIMMEILRSIWTNWGLSHPLFSSLGAMAAGLALWWAFGLVMWLSTPREKSEHLIAPPISIPTSTPAMPEKAEIKINPRVTPEEQDRIDEIFKNAPRVRVAISSLSAKEGEEARPALEAAAWLRDALEKAGVVTEFTPYGNPEMLYQGATIYWIKSGENNEMVSRIVKAAEIKHLRPREVTRPASRKCEIELMIGMNPYG